jgi:DNA-binding transcriptional LysR family regulator
MDFRWLQDFLSLAEAGNFTSAADARHSSQPAFSRRIQSLESWLGVELIDRSHYPTVLTPAGETFRLHAAELVKKMIDSRAELQGDPVGDSETVTFALPHTLAISRFPDWWKDWRESARGASCRLLASNVHDAVTALVGGLADILICFHHAQEPIFLDQERYDRIDLGTEWLKPYSAAHRGQSVFKLPGTAKSPVPVLRYSAGAFLCRMVDLIEQSAPTKLHGKTVCETDIANVLLEMAIAGHGIVWLPECMAAPAVSAGRLKLVGDPYWALPLTILIYRDRSHSTPAVDRIMSYLNNRAKREGSSDRIVPQLAGIARHPEGGKQA